MKYIFKPDMSAQTNNGTMPPIIVTNEDETPSESMQMLEIVKNHNAKGTMDGGWRAWLAVAGGFINFWAGFGKSPIYCDSMYCND